MLLENPQPNFARLRQVFLLQGEPDRVPPIELFADHEIMEAVLDTRIPPADPADPAAFEAHMRHLIQFYYRLGYDYVTVGPILNMPRKRRAADDTAELSHDQRHWEASSEGIINSWADFEAYPWPKPEDVNYAKVEFVGQHLPDGMQMIFLGPGGQLENIMWLMGYEPLAYALVDDPDLVDAVARRVGELLENVFATVAEMPNVGALWLGDDMGFKTQTMISPRHMQQYVFPYQRRLAEIAHSHDLPFLLHACGNLERIMPTLIEEVGIDAKHSFEDVIMPVTEAKRRYGDQIAILGGVDVDYLCRHSEAEVRAYTRHILDACMPGGGYALGTGNSVANYIPVRNYLAMLDEGRTYGVY
jgi:uroporphyrinogen decarboxylase